MDADKQRDLFKRIRITNEIKAISKDECFPLSPNLCPLLLDFIKHLDVDALDSTWLTIRYAYKITDEDIRDAIFFAVSDNLQG